ncbi:MAG TPA: carotenoid biosynthesis protein [Leptolyngbyaceae cyanobacterium M33_DOE_097]|uniref:Carotenoid biosynthesis protein n=1 Tax=Oscillatoriales cyanobacterium SpSt-418 TaxID=2282169 RepID=A0A7C3KIL6_9CYAN|nr:carotenoid biosynthesis protein [Leptolyngbyaceae cyanobacterium M33_DOE_097]
MKPLVTIERFSLFGHVMALFFGLAGLLLVLPNPALIATLPPFGQSLFGWSMAGGGVAYILLGAIAVALYARRVLGTQLWLGFMLPAIGLSLSSELLGTSTGFPFGHYGYLNGLGYKIAGLVPFTIPLSWFYVGLSTYVLARAGLENRGVKGVVREIGAIALGALLLTAWDFVLDPAMSQTPYPFWEFQDPGEFFGMPYRNLTGWLGTGALFMTVASFFWRGKDLKLTRSQLTLPLVVYLVNFGFGAAITIAQLDVRYWIPTAISVALGVVPAIAFWLSAKPALPPVVETASASPTLSPPEVATVAAATK